MAPEFVLQTGHNGGVDYWALGVTISMISLGRLPQKKLPAHGIGIKEVLGVNERRVAGLPTRRLRALGFSAGIADHRGLCFCRICAPAGSSLDLVHC